MSLDHWYICLVRGAGQNPPLAFYLLHKQPFPGTHSSLASSDPCIPKLSPREPGKPPLDQILFCLISQSSSKSSPPHGASDRT